MWIQGETQRAPSLLALSPTYARTQVMNPVYQQVVDHFLTTRSWFWWGPERKESVSKPYLHSCTAMRIGPGAKAQPLHRDDYISHNIHTDIDKWDDERDANRESAVGLFVAGSKVIKENGGTQFIQGSHLWGSERGPPRVEDCVYAEMDKGDAFIMLASAYHAGGTNSTKDQCRLVFATFSIRGFLRQEENQFLAVPRGTAMKLDQDIQAFMGYSMSDPACGYFQETLTVTPSQSSLQYATSDGIDVSPSHQIISSQPPSELLMPSDPVAARESASLSPENPILETSALTLTSPQTSATLSLSPDVVPFSISPSAHNDLESDITTNRNIIDYFDQTLSEHFVIHVPGLDNPFREYVLPLAYQHQGILHAMLGQRLVTVSLGYRLSAIRSLASLLHKEDISRLTPTEEEQVLAMVLLLVLHDICESGISTHGAHLTGVSFLCKRIACLDTSPIRSKTAMFLISALSWLDMIRGFSGAEKLSYSSEVRECVRDHGSLSLHTLVGCPPVIFFKIGQVLEAGKAYLAGDLPIEQFEQLLDGAEKFFRGWDPDQATRMLATRDAVSRRLRNLMRRPSDKSFCLCGFGRLCYDTERQRILQTSTISAVPSRSRYVLSASDTLRKLVHQRNKALYRTPAPRHDRAIDESLGREKDESSRLVKRSLDGISQEKNQAELEKASKLANVPHCEQYERMISGMLYDSLIPKLTNARLAARKAMNEYNTWFPEGDDFNIENITKTRAEMLKSFLGHVEDDEVFIEPPFRVDYGPNMSVGKRFYANFNLTVLDSAIVTIGDRVMIGPNVMISTATHETEVASRRACIEYAYPINIGDDCWIGGGVTILPNVTIGEGCTIGAGSIVTRDIPAWSVAVGSPARVVKKVQPLGEFNESNGV
ncbi:galactoside o-acetyltransferase [Fusarium sp. NRRL 52700]|nr:galactoside o-acetyltransferase [Fusarium sp. NRRL 52700]